MNKKVRLIPVYIYFIVVALLIILFFPREGKFRYSFTEGKPWQYGLLTTPFDFPVHKSKSELKREQDSIIQNFRPYFQLNDEIADRQIEHFEKNYQQFVHSTWTLAYKQYVVGKLKEIYTMGIVPVSDYNFLRENHYNIFLVFENDVAAPHSANDVFTVKSAYSYLLDNCPPHLNINVLKTGSLNVYLMDNLKYDEATSEKVKQDFLQKISPSSGMVQAGEKIIDRGEIVSSKTNNILESLKDVYEKRSGTVTRQGGLFLGIFILVAGLMGCFLLYLYYFRKNIYRRRKHIVFLLSLIGIFTLLTEVCVIFSLFNVYIIPFAIIPIAVRTFFDSRTAQMTHNIAILICSLMVPFPFEFLLLQFITCLVVNYALKDLTQRSQLIRCSFFILMTYVVVYIGLLLFQEGDFTKINWKMFLYFGINFIFLMFTYAFIYMIEKVFGYTSNVTLVELSDINSPVLREFSETCPGSFQHSLQVSVLGTAAAAKIGANPQLIRTGALYHDIGKMVNPAFFTENQAGNMNPHDRLTFVQSARIIINHVAEGVKIAEKYNLPSIITAFIRTHHGKGKTKYFYNSFKNKYPDQPVDEAAFTYPGPNPYSMETAILMMADAVEAASRSLKDYTEQSIDVLVNKIINAQMEEGLLSNTPLTFNNITEIKAVFIEKLVIMYHSRISYPELEEKS